MVKAFLLFISVYFISQSHSITSSHITVPKPSTVTCHNAWNYANSYSNYAHKCDSYSNITEKNTMQCVDITKVNLGSAYIPNYYYYFNIFIRREPCSIIEYIGHTIPRVNETIFEFNSNDLICVNGTIGMWFITLAKYNTNDDFSNHIQSFVHFGCTGGGGGAGWANDAMHYEYDFTFETSAPSNNQKQLTNYNDSCHNTGFSDPKWNAPHYIWNQTTLQTRCNWLGSDQITTNMPSVVTATTTNAGTTLHPLTTANTGSENSITIPDINLPKPSSVTCHNAWNNLNFDSNYGHRCDSYSNMTTSNTIQCIHFKKINLGSAYIPNYYYYFDVFIRRKACSSIEYVGHTIPRVNETTFEFISDDSVCINGKIALWFVTFTRYNPDIPYSYTAIQNGVDFGCTEGSEGGGWANDAMYYEYFFTLETNASINNEALTKKYNDSCHNNGYSDPKWDSQWNQTTLRNRCNWFNQNQTTDSTTGIPTAATESPKITTAAGILKTSIIGTTNGVIIESANSSGKKGQWISSIVLVFLGFIVGGIAMSLWWCCYHKIKNKKYKKMHDLLTDNVELVERDEFDGEEETVEGQTQTSI